MSEESTAVAEETYQYQIKVEDAGPATKKVQVEIPADRIKTQIKTPSPATRFRPMAPPECFRGRQMLLISCPAARLRL